MDKRKRQKKVAGGTSRWQASRLEGVEKNRGIKKMKKQKGARKERRLRKVVGTRSSKRSASRE